MTTLDRLAALRLGSRLARHRSLELQKRGDFIAAEDFFSAHVALEHLRFDLDAGMQELEQHGGDARGGMITTIEDDDEVGE